MAIKLADVFVPITGDDAPLKKTLSGTQKFLQGFVSNITQGIGQGIGQAILSNIGRGVNLGVNLIKQSVKAASDLNESLNKVVVAFGTSAKAIIAWSETSEMALLLSKQGALEAASSFGLLFSSMGLTNEESARMSMKLVQLAADLASIGNTSVEEALTAIRAGMVGEAEPLKKYGILLNAANVEQEALNAGLAESKKQITELDKVQARFNIVMQQSVKSQGDVARTLEGIANQERELAARRESALAQLGAAFAPLYQVILININRILGQVEPYGENIVRMLAEGITNGVIWLLPALSFIKKSIEYWLKPGSPPKILPDLAKWGAGWMNSLFSGFEDADFGVIKNLGGTIEGLLRSFVTSGDVAENDIVERVFGTRKAVLQAVREWHDAGQVTTETLNAISQSAGAAGTDLAGLVRAYFDLEGASRRAADAQKELTDVTEAYDRALAPLNAQLTEINDKQQAIRDRQATSAARKTLRDPAATANEKRMALLDIEEIKIKRQITGVERERDKAVDAAQAKLKAAQKQQEVAQAVFAVQQALLEQQVTTNQLIGEENALRKKQAEDAERLYQATLAFNMATATTAGKLALLQLELTRTKEGSVEYFGVLTQIAGVQEQLANEAAAGDTLIPSDGVLPNVDDIGVPEWVKELTDRLNSALEEFFPTISLHPTPVAGGLDFSQGKQILPAGPVEETDTSVKNFVDTLKELTLAVQGLVGPMEVIAGLFGFSGDESAKSAMKTETATDDILVAVKNTGGAIKDAGDRNWAGAFVHLREVVATGLVGIANLLPGTDGSEPEDSASPIQGLTLMGQAFWALLGVGVLTGQGGFVLSYLKFLQWIRDQLPGSEPKDPSSPLFGLADAGESIIDQIWSGLKTKWTELSGWWTEKMQWLRDMLPGSEPKNPDSPLRGLVKTGEALVNQIQLGINQRDLDLPVANRNLLAAGATSVAGGTSRQITVQTGAIQINGVNGAGDMMTSLEAAFDEFLKRLANG